MTTSAKSFTIADSRRARILPTSTSAYAQWSFRKSPWGSTQMRNPMQDVLLILQVQITNKQKSWKSKVTIFYKEWPSWGKEFELSNWFDWLHSRRGILDVPPRNPDSQAQTEQSYSKCPSNWRQIVNTHKRMRCHMQDSMHKNTLERDERGGVKSFFVQLLGLQTDSDLVLK